MQISQSPQRRGNSVIWVVVKLDCTGSSAAQCPQPGGAGHPGWLLGNPSSDVGHFHKAANCLPCHRQERLPAPPFGTISASTHLCENARPQIPSPVHNSIPEMLSVCQDPCPLQEAFYGILNPVFT